MASDSNLCVLSYNMHGYNQGVLTLKDCIAKSDIGVIMVQEHWLTPANLNRFNIDFTDYYAFGSSALGEAVSSGPLYGRPYGGTMILLKNNLLPMSNCIYASERFVIIKVGDIICINVYFPCVGTVDRQFICEEILSDILAWRYKYPECGCVLGGDFNTDLDSVCNTARFINKSMVDNDFIRCDLQFPTTMKYTYANESLNHYSKIDFFLCNNVSVLSFEICDPDINFSDHLPLQLTCNVKLSQACTQDAHKSDDQHVLYPRWDHADLLTYYNQSFCHLQPILNELFDLTTCIDTNESVFNPVCIDEVYVKIVNALKLCSADAVPMRSKHFFKFWWSQELDCLKDNAIESDKLWKAAGRPRSGPLYSRRSTDKRAYRAAIRKNKRDSDTLFTNDLHDALLSKQGDAFWKCWNSKVANKSPKCLQIDGSINAKEIADNFARHFEKSCCDLSVNGSERLSQLYETQRCNYVGSPMLLENRIDAELVETIIKEMKRGKAAGLDGLSVEHLSNCHPILPGILARLFNLILKIGHVPNQFGMSYTVPLIKVNGCTKNLSVDDFRGISISPVISKIFEHCILRRFNKYFTSSDNQFGFKKAVGCSHAIYTVRSVINHYVSNGSTVNLCALDVSKAFDKMNHHGLFIKLMNRLVPLTLLSVLEDWFSHCYTYVKWLGSVSFSFTLSSGIRQGGVLSPYLFAVYIDDLIIDIVKKSFGCTYNFVSICIVVYADDILLLAPSLAALQQLVSLCEFHLQLLDLAINIKKSFCTRIGPRFNAQCTNIVTFDGSALHWVDSLRYLGIFIVRARSFKCSLLHAKQSFFRAFNAIYGKIGGSASEEIILSLIKSKCLPCLLYGLDACPINVTEGNSLNFTVRRTLFKIFHTTSPSIILDCQLYFSFPDVTVCLKLRKCKFLRKFSASDNTLCHALRTFAQCELTSLT